MRPDIYAELEALHAELAAIRVEMEAVTNRTRTKTWYTRTEAAAYLNISTTKLWELRGSGRLVGHQIDGRPVFHIDDLDAVAIRDKVQGAT